MPISPQPWNNVRFSHRPLFADGVHVRVPDQSDAATEYPAHLGIAYTCVEPGCQRMGLVAHCHKRRPYLVYSNEWTKRD
jgi:hypothetical protein